MYFRRVLFRSDFGEVVRQIECLGADPNLLHAGRGFASRQPILLHAIQRENKEIAEYLIWRGANVTLPQEVSDELRQRQHNVCLTIALEIGRASVRERVVQYGKISGVAES